MLVVISDLHMEEEASAYIDGVGNQIPIHFSRNLSPKAYINVIASLAGEARRNHAREMHLVLAGDVFDITRTGLWFQNNLTYARPYVDNDGVDEVLEEKILEILDGIANTPRNREGLKTFQQLAQGKYWDRGEWQDFPVPVQLYYLPGNHDRLADATPRIRRKVRQLLGLPAFPEPFRHQLFFANERTAVRHGHEYDRYNFSLDTTALQTIPFHVPEKHYNKAPFGDFVTVDIASRLPQLFRNKYGDGAILENDDLRQIYMRTIEFDDLRPQSAMLRYLLHMPQAHMTPERVWDLIKSTLHDLIEAVYDDPFLTHWLQLMDDKWRPDVIDAVQAVLELKAWRWGGISLGMAEKLSEKALGRDASEPHPEHMAAREKIVRSGEAKFLIAGHTHRPKLALLDNDEKGERYYIDTGTWRHQIFANQDYTAFGSLKTLTYAVVYGPDEDMGDVAAGMKLASVDTWTGFTQRW